MYHKYIILFIVLCNTILTFELIGAEYSPPGVEIQSPDNNYHTKDSRITVKVKIDSSSAPVNDIHIFVNDKEVDKKVSDSLTFNKVVIKDYYVDLSEGKNLIKIVATNTNNLTAFDIVIVFREQEIQKGTLYFLSIGVNHLENISNNDLDFASKDARDMLDLMEKMKGKLYIYKEVKSTVFTDDSKNKPYSNVIEDALYNHFKQANDDDTVMIFLAGHGESIKSNQYIFLTRNAKKYGNGDYQMSTVLKWSSINAALKNLKCNKIIILDTCYTGGVDISSFSLNNSEKVILFTSTSQGQVASECREQQNGCFTYAIKKGFSDDLPADLNKDCDIKITELKDYVDGELKKMSLNQSPDIRLPSGGGNFVIYNYRMRSENSDEDKYIKNIENKGELTQEYIDLRNEYLMIISKQFGIKFKPLPQITKNNTLTLEAAKEVYKKCKHDGRCDKYTEDFRYITSEAAKFLTENLNEVHNIVDRIVFLQSEAAEYFAKTNKFIRFLDLETMTTATAKALGSHKEKYIYMHNIKYLSVEQAKALFKHKEYLTIFDLAYLDHEIAEAMANNNNQRVAIGHYLDENEKAIWMNACDKYGWRNCLGNSPTLSKNESIQDCVSKVTECANDSQFIESIKKRQKEQGKEELITFSDCFLRAGFHDIFNWTLANSKLTIDPLEEICRGIVWESNENKK